MRRALSIARVGARGALRHPVRSLLTAATTAVAIAVTVNVISLVYGLDADVRRDSSTFGRRTVDVVRVPTLIPGLQREPLGDAERRRIQAAVADLGASTIGRRVGAARVIAEDGSEVSVGLVAAEAEFRRTFDIPLLAGRWLRVDEEHASCLVDAAVAEAAFPNLPASDAVGRTLSVRRGEAIEELYVVGVLSDPITHRALLDAFDELRGARPLAAALYSFRNVYLPPKALGEGEYSGVSVVASSDAEVDEIARRLRAIWPVGDDPLVPRRSVGVFVRREWLDLFGDTSQTGALLSNLVWMIIVGVAVVMLTTLALLTIRERFDELAIRRVEGATRRDVALQVTAEGVLLSLVGGLAGLPLGYAGAALMRRMVDFPFRFGLSYALVAVGVSVVVGLLASVLPARRAAGLQPVTVLSRRHT